jgi:hypothetical protein
MRISHRRVQAAMSEVFRIARLTHTDFIPHIRADQQKVKHELVHVYIELF